ncbi:MAG: hypothetical protein B1H05_00175 [Candidatus Cloacimonas sp. 4484_140]|nr:MAG: hypothetical protein B1H05_00175 [Candidatus Cloacimonas sp. 4484_140]
MQLANKKKKVQNMPATFTLPDGDTILIPQIKRISKIYAYKMDMNRGVVKRIEDHKQPKSVSELVSIERYIDVIDKSDIASDFSYIGFDIVLYDNDVKRVFNDFYIELKRMQEQEDFTYEHARAKLRDIIRSIVTVKEDLITSIEDFYQTHGTLKS